MTKKQLKALIRVSAEIIEKAYSGCPMDWEEGIDEFSICEKYGCKSHWEEASACDDPVGCWERYFLEIGKKL